MSSSSAPEPPQGIAIIGMAGRFPKARNVAEFWRNLCNGIEGTTFFSAEELEAAGVERERYSQPNYVPARAILADAEWFDAAFFGIGRREAEVMDPQHRVILECAWETLEDAGYDPDRFKGWIGVYAGSSMNTYLMNNLLGHPELLELVGDYQTMLGNDKDYLPTRVAYKLNLRGPAISIQTACSTSLVAVCLACQSLLQYQCDLALAGGVSITFPQTKGYLYQEGGILSPDGHCRTFDRRAQGTFSGQGVGLVALRRLEEALAAGDHIYAVIRGTAINNDGAAKVGYTAPSVDGQAAVIRMAQAVAEVDPATISYVEAHGTGTPMGDPIELAGLTAAFGAAPAAKRVCALGSVKSSIGHLDAAAGVAGLIKATLALKHQTLPPSLNFEEPNPNIDFANGRFYVNSHLSNWPAGSTPRRAGVSSFGIGGTNAHVVLEEAPAAACAESHRPSQLLTLSSRSPAALETMTDNLAEHLRQEPGLNLADVAYTLHLGRRAFDCRRVVVGTDAAAAVSALEARHPKRVLTAFREAGAQPPGLAFLFTGQGAQYVNMGQQLYQAEPVFREQVDACAEFLRPHLDGDLRDMLYPAGGFGRALTASEAEAAAQRLRCTAVAQPALFVLEYALARLWMAWGIQPQAMLGHSIGEYTAACLAGVFSLEDALTLVAARGRMMQALPGGAMLALSLTEDRVRTLVDGRLSLAAINGPTQCVVSGPTDLIEDLQRQLRTDGVDCRRLHTSHAFHSEMMAPILQPFTALVRDMHLSPPRIPFISNVTGTWITAAEATEPGYWARHLRQAVRFADGLRLLFKEPNWNLVEVGPGSTLCTLARQHPDRPAQQLVLSSVRHPQEQQSDEAFLLTALGQLWLSGAPVDWAGFHAAEHRRRLPLPTYPFERQRYWVEPRQRAGPAPTARSRLAKKPDMADWFYRPAWRRQDLPRQADDAISGGGRNWLMFEDDCGVALRLSDRLRALGRDVVRVRAGERFGQSESDIFHLNPCRAPDYDALVSALQAQARLPDRIVHLWQVTRSEVGGRDLDWDESTLDQGFYSLLFLAQAIGRQNITRPMELEVVSTGLQLVVGDEVTQPSKATALGPGRVIPQEFRNLRCRSIDIAVPTAGSELEHALIEQLLGEFGAHSSDVVIAYRGLQRWVQDFESVRLDDSAPATGALRQGGVYLITGGLGRMGLSLAGFLANTVKAKLVLLGRSALLPRAAWSNWLETHAEQDALSTRIRRVQALEAAGSEVLVLSADVADLGQMQQALAQAGERFGPLHGVIHAAGTVSLAPIPSLDRARCVEQFRSKGLGVAVLQRVLQGQALDFCLVTSSLSAVLGGLGYAAYAAANQHLDAFVAKHNQVSAVPWISVNWDAWRWPTQAGELKPFRSSAADLYLAPDEGVEAFHHILRLLAPRGGQVVVSSGDLQTRIDQWVKLASPAAQPAETRAPAQPSGAARPLVQDKPRTALEAQLAGLWRELLGVEQVGIHDDFFDLGGSSLIALRLFAQIEKQWNKKLPLASLYQARTVADLAALLGDAKPEPAPAWSLLVPIQAEGSRPPIYFIHSAGGNVLLYRDLARHLGPDQPVYGVQAQGLDGAQPILTSIEAMAAKYTEEIQARQPAGPYLLGGYCMGGTIALEIAQRLTQQGHPVALLALLETYNWRNMTADRSVADLARFYAQKIRFHWRNFLLLNAREKRIFLAEKLMVTRARLGVWYGRALAKLGRQVTPRNEAHLRLGRLWATNDQAALDYRPVPYPGRITHFCPREEYTRHQGAQVGWEALAAGGVDKRVLPVYPAAMLVEPFAAQTAQVLRACISQALEPVASH